MKQKEFEERWKKSIREFTESEEKKCGDWQSEEGLSAQSRRRLWERIAEEERKSLPTRPFRLRRRYIPVLAAVLVLALGMGAAGSRAWISGSRDMERQSEVSTKVNNEEKNSILLQEEDMYREIGETLGIVPMRFGYQPEGMRLDRYTVGDGVGRANVYYLYNGSLVSVTMMKQSIEISSNLQWDGESRKLEFDSELYEIEAYCVDEDEHNYGANITYGNGYYAIFGKFEDENEFLEILKKIYFKKV